MYLKTVFLSTSPTIWKINFQNHCYEYFHLSWEIPKLNLSYSVSILSYLFYLASWLVLKLNSTVNYVSLMEVILSFYFRW